MYFSDALRDHLNDQIEAFIGASAELKIYSGSAPANEAASLSGNTLLAEVPCPSDWMAASSGGVKSLLGTWSDSSANASGTATFARLTKADDTVVIQITVGASGAELNLTTASIVSGQPVTITQFDLTAPG